MPGAKSLCDNVVEECELLEEKYTVWHHVQELMRLALECYSNKSNIGQHGSPHLSTVVSEILFSTQLMEQS